MSFLQLHHVVKRYQMGQTLVSALNDIELSIEAGEFVVAWGPSGCGKTTLLNLLATIDVPTEGDCLIDGTSVKTMTDRERTHLRQQRIGIIFQNFNLVPVMNALENVMLPGQVHGGKQDPQLKHRAQDLLNQVGVGEYAKHRPDELSGGQRQRVALARALVNRPDLVIADEPTANLDSVNSARIVELLAELNERFGTTFLFSTHDHVLLRSGKRKLQLSDGYIINDAMRDDERSSAVALQKNLGAKA